MKPILRGVLLFTVSTSLLAVIGCRSRPVHAEETVVTPPPPPAPVTVVVAAPAPTPAPAAPRAPIIITKANPAPAPAPTAAPAEIPTTPATAAAPVEPAVPPSIEISPALAEVVKLVQGGVGEDVLMAYVTNSTEVFDLGSEQILYLHDLGVPSHLITALIQQDSTPEALARKQAVATATAPAPAPAAVAPTTTTTTAQAPAVVYTVPPAEQPVVINQFYTDLAPYGTWIDVAGYGRCWRPTVSIYNTSWRPYCDGGRWVWTDHGWYWYSDYSWGWAPFHYGRWHSHASFGWVWTPDVHWGPAWVSWRRSGDYCAWAPLPPFATFSIGLGWHHRGRRYNDECDFIPHHRYVALPIRHLHAARPSQHLVAARQAEVAVRSSSAANTHSAVNRTVINRGVPVDDVAQSSGRPIRPVSLRPTSDVPRVHSRRETLDADGKTITIARPSLTPATAGERPAARPGNSTSNPRVNVTRGPGNSTATTPPATSTPVVRDPSIGNPASPRPGATRGATRSVDSGNNPPANVGVVTPRSGNPGTTRGSTPTVVTPPTVTPPAAPTQPRVTRDNGTPPPRGGRPSGNTGENNNRPAVVSRPATTPNPTPAPVVRVPAPAPAPISRAEPSRSQTPPPAARPPVFNAPAPRASSPAPSPSFNSPRPSSPSPAPRVESRPSPPPSRSSGENTPRVSPRSSGEENGRRNSR